MAADLAERRGFCYLDKHGDSAKRIADSSPQPIIYWQPASLSHVIGLNPLHNVPPDERWKVTANIVSVFSDIWGLGEQTPRLIYFLRASLRLLLDTHGSTLLDIRRVLSDPEFRRKLLKSCKDDETRQTWREFDAKDARQQAQEIGSLQNKVAALADALPLRLVLGQKTSTINLRKIIDRGTVMVCDLSGMGDEPARLLGALLVSSFAQAAEARSEMAEAERRDYTLYIDEFQNFASLALRQGPQRSAQVASLDRALSSILRTDIRARPARSGLGQLRHARIISYRRGRRAAHRPRTRRAGVRAGRSLARTCVRPHASRRPTDRRATYGDRNGDARHRTPRGRDRQHAGELRAAEEACRTAACAAAARVALKKWKPPQRHIRRRLHLTRPEGRREHRAPAPSPWRRPRATPASRSDNPRRPRNARPSPILAPSRMRGRRRRARADRPQTPWNLKSAERARRLFGAIIGKPKTAD